MLENALLAIPVKLFFYVIIFVVCNILKKKKALVLKLQEKLKFMI